MENQAGLCFLAGFLFTILIVSVTTIGILLVRRIRVRGESKESPHALDIAKQRYASGDISREEFEQIKEDLS